MHVNERKTQLQGCHRYLGTKFPDFPPDISSIQTPELSI